MTGNRRELPRSKLAGRQPRLAPRQGFTTNLLNPKIAIFYMALLPHFIVPGIRVVLKSLFLTGIHNLMSFAWLTGYAWLVSRAHDVL